VEVMIRWSQALYQSNGRCNKICQMRLWPLLLKMGSVNEFKILPEIKHSSKQKSCDTINSPGTWETGDIDTIVAVYVNFLDSIPLFGQPVIYGEHGRFCGPEIFL